MLSKIKISPLIVLAFLLLPRPVDASNEVILEDKAFIDLESVANRLRMRYQWVEPRKSVEIQNKSIQLLFEKEKRHININDGKIWLGDPVRSHRGRLYISKEDFKWGIMPLLTPQAFASPPKLYRIVIDPGHGGKDDGTINEVFSAKEKDLALDISKRLKEILVKYGYDVHLTRTDDSFIPLADRPEIANRLMADLFVSIHLNSIDSIKSDQVKGVETYILTLPGQSSTDQSIPNAQDKVGYPGNRNDAWNALLAQYIQRGLVNDLATVDRGVRRARFKVLKTLKCPGVLIESGFLSNPKECKLFKSPVYRDQVAQAIAKSLLKYQHTLDRIRAFQSQAS